MAGNFSDNTGVMALAKIWEFSTPSIPRSRPKWTEIHPSSPCESGVCLKQVFHNQELVGATWKNSVLLHPRLAKTSWTGVPCSARSHRLLHSPYGERVSLCASFRFQRQCAAAEIPRHLAPFLRAERSPLDSRPGSSHLFDLRSRGNMHPLPGLAYMEGNMRGPSTADCEKSFQRTGIPSANMLKRTPSSLRRSLIQIQIPPQLGAKPQRCTKRCTRRELPHRLNCLHLAKREGVLAASGSAQLGRKDSCPCTSVNAGGNPMQRITKVRSQFPKCERR